MKFINLLKKELSELVNKQMILGLVITGFIFIVLGGIMETTVDKVVESAANSSVNICDRDKTALTEELITAMKQSGVSVTEVDAQGDDYAAILNKEKLPNLIIIPEGFTDGLDTDTPPTLISIENMRSTGNLDSLESSTDGGLSTIQTFLSTILATEAGLSPEDIANIEAPFLVDSHTVVKEKAAQITMSEISYNITTKNMMLPIIVFILIVMTSQTLVSAVANEKIDKTLETLLSAPVSRTAVICSKMLAAAIVALINAVVYMLCFSSFISGSFSEMSDAATEIAGRELTVDEALRQLGLSLSIGDIILVGAQLFMTIMICLSLSLILGALVNDTKSTQSVIMPIMLLAMVPYFISMISDVNMLPTVLKWLVYAIPFTHTFSAMSNLMFGNTALFFGGLAYQIVIFGICMFLALRLFKSDKIFTISLNIGQKSRYTKKNKRSAEDR